MPGYLKVRRPSPTTVCFTVSNASQCLSPPAKIFSCFQFLLRAFLFACVVFVDIARLRSAFFAQDGSFVRWTAIWSSPLGQSACRIADAYSTLVIVVASALVTYAVFRKGYTGVLQMCYIMRDMYGKLMTFAIIQRSRSW